MTVVLPNQPNGLSIVKMEDAQAWHKLFAEAEQRIKQIEHTQQGLDIPAINELRYVAFHLLEALVSDQVGQDRHKPKILSHIQRAIYDACEALISIHLHDLRRFQEDYRLVVVSEVIKDYSSLMEKAEEAKRLISETRRGHDGRASYYEIALQHVDTLTQINATLLASRDELNKKLTNQRKESRRWVIGTLLVLCGIVAGLVIKFAPSQKDTEQASLPVVQEAQTKH